MTDPGISLDPESSPTEPLDRKPERSTIKFPYSDLKEAVKVAQMVHDKFGSGCDIDQLAGEFGQTVSSGSFRTRIATAAMFGLVASRRLRVTLTERGHHVVDPQRVTAAKVEAFLSIPLYEALYKLYRNKTLPGDAGLTAEIRSQGVLASQADRARQVMQRSAEQAGFFASGRDRLVQPAVGTIEPANGAQETGSAASPNGSSGGDENMAESPLLQGLWGMLPAAGEFPAEKRAQWFRALAVNLDLVYGDSSVKVSVESPRSLPASDTHA